MTELKAMIKTLNYAGYAVLPAEELAQLKAKVSDATDAVSDAAQWCMQENPECGHPKACLVEDEGNAYCGWCSDVNDLQDRAEAAEGIVAGMIEALKPVFRPSFRGDNPVWAAGKLRDDYEDLQGQVKSLNAQLKLAREQIKVAVHQGMEGARQGYQQMTEEARLQEKVARIELEKCKAEIARLQALLVRAE